MGTLMTKNLVLLFTAAFLTVSCSETEDVASTSPATAEDAKAFSTLFTFEEAARRLSEDFANYTPSAPEVIISRVHELPDMDGMIRDFQTSEAA